MGKWLGMLVIFLVLSPGCPVMAQTTEVHDATTYAEIVALRADVDRSNFLLQTIAAVNSFIWGGYTWRLIVLAKNQRSIW